MTWKETSPNVWQRDLDEVELFWAKVAKLYDYNGRRPFEITGHVSLQVQTSTPSLEDANKQVNAALEAAWINLRRDHPTLASYSKYDFTQKKFVKTYRCISGKDEREQWLRATLVHVTDNDSGEAFANGDPAVRELPTMFVIHRDASLVEGAYLVRRDLAFRAAHDTIDGAGTLLLLGNLVRHASRALEDNSSVQLPALDGSETSNLSPPYRIAAAIPPTPSQAIQKRIDQMVSEHVHFGPNAGPGRRPQLSLPFNNHQVQAPGKNQRVEIILDKPTVSKLLAACKAAGVTITHIFHAAIPLVMRDLQVKGQEEERYNSVLDLLYNLRSFCAEPYNTPAHAVTAYHSGSSKGCRIEVAVAAADAPEADDQSWRNEFARVLSEIVSLYKFVRNDTDQGQIAPYIWAGLLANMPEVPETPPHGPPPSPSPSASISSLGKVDDVVPPQVGRISVSHPWVMGEEMGNSYGLFMVTHGGELSLHSCCV